MSRFIDYAIGHARLTIATLAAYRHLGVAPPKSAPDLFDAG